MNPYQITGPAQIGVSGGRTSGHMLWKILEAHGGKLPEDVHAFFQNTGKEREETLVFIDAIAKHWGLNIVWMEWCRVYGQPDDAPWYKIVDFETASRNGEPFTMMLEYYQAYRKAEKNLPAVLPNFSNNMCTDALRSVESPNECWHHDKLLTELFGDDWHYPVERNAVVESHEFTYTRRVVEAVQDALSQEQQPVVNAHVLASTLKTATS